MAHLVWLTSALAVTVTQETVYMVLDVLRMVAMNAEVVTVDID